ncbi:SLH domain protein isoform X2 [Tasmannia lanceolata]|uniref:SLH domain protein isoform X2 n=1 Tax=Tasmannia lanceolata TaxID=3420 RepID=UPI00406347EF
MSSSLSPSSPFTFIYNRYHFRSPNPSLACSSNPFLNFHTSRYKRLTLLASVAQRRLESSWIPSDCNSDEDYGGWSIVEARIDTKKGWGKFFLLGIGTSIAILLAAIIQCSASGKGFKCRVSAPLQSIRGLFIGADSEPESVKLADSDASQMDTEYTSRADNLASDALDLHHVTAPGEKLKRVIVSVPADPTQEEALLVLKKLKVIENDVKSDELCTKREFARWLVKENSLLERNPKHWIVPPMLTAGSTVGVFNDVSVADPDFWCIQALAEAGIVPSKLISPKFGSLDVDSSERQARVEFFPDSFISRLDLVNWITQLEYSLLPGIEEKVLKPNLFTVQMLRKGVGFMDVEAVGPSALPELFMDMLAGDKSIVRKVFGYSRRLQPHRPVTKAQAAVALTSARMTDLICAELSRLEAENSSRQVEMDAIMSELLLRGEIPRFWEGKLNEEKAHGLEVERELHAATLDLEKEKSIRAKRLAKFLREKAALDCQRQLLLSFKEEVRGMYERVACETANAVAEQRRVEELSADLQAKQEAMIEEKCILECEKEAVRLLRSWIEDEGKKNQARAKVLEEAGRRWKWNTSSSATQTCSPQNENAIALQETSAMRVAENGRS